MMSEPVLKSSERADGWTSVRDTEKDGAEPVLKTPRKEEEEDAAEPVLRASGLAGLA